MARSKKYQIARVLRSGLQNFRRNLGLSLATMFVTTLTLLAVSLVVAINFLLSIALDSVESKVDISVFYNPLASGDQIAKSRAEITNIAGIANTQLISKEDALKKFSTEHADNELIKASLSELDENPLQTTLVITADDPQLYESINEKLTAKVDGQIIDRINYDDNRETINRLSRIASWARTGGLIVSGILAFIAILVVYNTVRLTIYSRGEEVSIMKLVGATNGFVRGPFIIEGIMYGLVSSLITIAIIQPALIWLSPRVEGFFGTTSASFQFMQDNLILVIFAELLIGALLGVVSSMLAVRRYLKV